MKNLFIKNRTSPRKKKRLPLVSVVMPVYNAEKYVGVAIESIMRQTYKRFELIIIDDESTDQSLAIAKSYKRHFRTKITIIETGRNLNGGGDMCANLGIEHARGKYIARMDADDIAVKDRLEKQVAFLEKNKRVFLVGSNAYIINKNGKIIGDRVGPNNPSDIYRSYAIFNPIVNSSIMLRRIFAGKYFSYQTEYDMNNDYYTFFRLAAKGYIFVNLSEKLLLSRASADNDSYEKVKKNFLNTLSIRFNMLLHSNYRFTIRDFFANFVQAVVLVILPKTIVKNLPSYSDLLKPFAVPLPL